MKMLGLYFMLVLVLSSGASMGQEYELEVVGPEKIWGSAIENTDRETLKAAHRDIIISLPNEVDKRSDEGFIACRVSDNRGYEIQHGKIIPYVEVDFFKRVPKKSTAPNAPTGLRIVE